VLVVATAMFLAVSAAVVDTGHRMIERSRAQTAADAAALGSVVGGRRIAEELAARHGATLVSFEQLADRVIVVVRVGAATADAAASDVP
jgi:hypothetical protein